MDYEDEIWETSLSLISLLDPEDPQNETQEAVRGGGQVLKLLQERNSTVHSYSTCPSHLHTVV